MRVLVVDDDTMNRQILSTVLHAGGHDVVEAVDGVEGLEAARRDRPDVMITDIFMPRLDGYQLCMRVRQDPDLCHIPFVFYTAMYTDSADEEFALRLGADALLTKPTDPRVLVETLEAAAEHRTITTPTAPEDEAKLLREYANRIIDRLTRNVDELNITNELLRESNDTLTALVESSPLGVALIGNDCEVRMWNPAAERIFGWTAEEVVGVLNPLLPDGPDSPCEFLEGLHAGTVVQDMELTRKRRDGEEVIVSVSAAPLLSAMQAVNGQTAWRTETTAPEAESPDGGDVMGFIVLMDDITKRQRQAAELRRTVERLENAMEGSVHVIAKIVETRDPYTAGHEERVAKLAVEIARRMGLSEETLREIRTAGIVHDIGKISVPTEILTKPTKLTDPELSIIRIHPQVGCDILQVVEFDWPIADIVCQHHERMDGSGYPGGLKGEEILLEARIIAVADVVEAMSSHRPYRPARGLEEAITEITEGRGVLYDSEVVDACLEALSLGGFPT